MTLPKMKKSKDFEYDGIYHVEVGGKTRHVYFDRSLHNSWRDADEEATKYGRAGGNVFVGHLGWNKQEALEALVKKYESAPTLGSLRVNLASKPAVTWKKHEYGDTVNLNAFRNGVFAAGVVPVGDSSDWHWSAWCKSQGDAKTGEVKSFTAGQRAAEKHLKTCPRETATERKGRQSMSKLMRTLRGQS